MDELKNETRVTTLYISRAKYGRALRVELEPVLSEWSVPLVAMDVVLPEAAFPTDAEFKIAKHRNDLDAVKQDLDNARSSVKEASDRLKELTAIEHITEETDSI